MEGRWWKWKSGRVKVRVDRRDDGEINIYLVGEGRRSRRRRYGFRA